MTLFSKKISQKQAINEINCVESKSVTLSQRFLKIFLNSQLPKVESHKSPLSFFLEYLSWRVKVLYLLKSNTSVLLGDSWKPVPEDFCYLHSCSEAQS